MGDVRRAGRAHEVIDGNHGRLSFRRLILRFGIALWVLLAAELALTMLMPEPDFESAYRLPRTKATASLPSFVHHIEHAEGTGDVALFLGASPTYGHAVKSDWSTWSEAYEMSAFEAGYDVRSYNLASDGQFLGDQRVIAERLADDASFVFVQLTYHTFNPLARDGRELRYPELPRLLGVTLPPSEARVAGIAETQSVTPVSAPVERELRDRWSLYRRREAICERLFGGSPREALRLGRRLPRDRAAMPSEASFQSFDSLDPGRQMIVVSRYAENASFTVEPGDPQVRLLDGLVRSLRRHQVRAVFYMSPMNRDLVESYELLDPASYARNVAVLREVVEREGFLFLDYNSGKPRFSGELFADVSHTTDKGALAVGRALFDDSRSYVYGGSLARAAEVAARRVSVVGGERAVAEEVPR